MHSRMRTLITAALLAGAVTVLPAGPAQAVGSVVKVTGSQGNWQLTVDGSPYLVKGVTWGPSPADAGRACKAYYAVKRAYGGNTAGDNLPPTVSVPSVPNPAAVAAGKEVVIQAPATDPEADQLSYEVLWGGRYVDGGAGGGTLKATAPAKTGVWKLYVKVKDGRGNVGVEQRSVKVVPPPVAGTDVTKGRPTTASTFQDDGWGGCPCTPQLATNGLDGTRWASS
ncbi:hypothetical protein ACFWBF_32665 [Streptomyces sp. NPDC060028]|uniref:hypothetical protein n=1 Tax=Streptomyces sp. NPDC060028 TaxID=3347041 RepID=UPI003684AFF3